MGFQVRKRTKGKTGWWNGSYSKKGLGASGSFKIGENITVNTGDLINGKTRGRTTINLGNGIRYVAYSKKPSARRAKTQTTPQYTPDGGGMNILVWLFLLFLLIITLDAIFTYPFWAAGIGIGSLIAYVIYRVWL